MPPATGDHTEYSGGAHGSETGVGAMLRTARMRLGEDLRSVAQMLCIRYPYLEAIEEGRFKELPGQTYAIGFIRAYSDHLGLDSDEVIRRYKVETAAGARGQELSFPTPVPETGIPGGAIVFVGIVVAVIAYGAWYISTSENNILADLVSPVPERLAEQTEGAEQGTPSSEPEQPTETAELAAPAEDTEPTAEVSQAEETDQPAPADEAGSTGAETASVSESESETAPEAVPAPEPPPEATALPEDAAIAEDEGDDTPPPEEIADESTEDPTEEPAEEPVEERATQPLQEEVATATEPASPAVAPSVETSVASTSGPRIVLRAKTSSWIQVRDDAANQMLVTRLLRAGETYEVPDRPGLKLLTGNAGALEVVVDGQVAPSIGDIGVVRRGVVLDAERLLAGTAVDN